MFCYISGEARVNELLYSKRLILHFHSFLDIFLRGVAHQLITTDSTSSVTASIGSNICSFHVVYLLQAHVNLNGTKWLTKMEWKSFKNNQRFLIRYLEYGRKLPVEEQCL